MTANDPPSEGNNTAPPASESPRSYLQEARSRRRLLQQLTVGGSFVLARCGKSGSNQPNDTAGAGGSHQTFRIPITENAPNKTSFFRHAPEAAFASVVKETPEATLDEFVWERGAWLDGVWATGNYRYNWIDEIDRTPEAVTISIRDDATWSDGHEITGKDIAVPVMDITISHNFRPAYASERKDEPSFVIGAFDDFDLTERSVTYRSSQGHFAKFWDWAIGWWLGGLGANFVPTHIAPYDAYAEDVIETVRRAQTGEINPWGDDQEAWETPSAPTKETLRKQHFVDRKYVEKFSKPENVLATGAWDLVELRGAEEFVFEKNPHHRNADSINFERTILEYTSSDDREQAALKADRLDYGSGVTPESVVKSLPANLTQLRIPGGWLTGNELGLNFTHPALGKRNVRLALMYALDNQAIAGNIQQSTAIPVETPGGDSWHATDYVSEKWIDENLTTYTTDREKAANLMRTAGYRKDGGRWIGADGEPIILTLATTSSTPRWEPTVASQLSQFGIQTSVKTLSDLAFENRVEAGEFPMWAARGSSTSTAAATLTVWLSAVENPQQHGIYPEKQFATGRFSDDGHPLPRTEDRWRIFTIRAAPIGRPEGTLKEYHPSALALAFLTNPPEAEFRHRVKTGMWLANWFLPTIPINKTLQQHFIDDTHWQWPTDTPSWKTFSSASGWRRMGGILASGAIQANPDNPEDAE